MEQIKSPLKWAGGKRWIIQHLRPLFDPSKRLVEPFCGAVSVALGLQPRTALLNDVNGRLVNFLRCLQNGLKIVSPLENDKEFYYKAREEFNNCLDNERAAELFYYLNRTGFNGLCRFNKSGKFNVPFGSYAKINYQRDFSEYVSVMAGWEITCMDFSKIEIDRGDFIYADPPYDVQFTQYSNDGFSWDDQVRLAEWLSWHQGPVVASNQATDRILDLYKSKGFKIRILEAPRMISCTGNRDKAKEILAIRGIDE